MNYISFLALDSHEAVRPVFLMVLGVVLTILTWRLARTSGVWTARFLVAGALLLGFGYAVMMPLFEAGVIERYVPGAQGQRGAATALAWHVVKIVVMNTGWLLFGTGIAMHAKSLDAPASRPCTQSPNLTHP
jgi:hypothetical protein